MRRKKLSVNNFEDIVLALHETFGRILTPKGDFGSFLSLITLSVKSVRFVNENENGDYHSFSEYELTSSKLNNYCTVI